MGSMNRVRFLVPTFEDVGATRPLRAGPSRYYSPEDYGPIGTADDTETWLTMFQVVNHDVGKTVRIGPRPVWWRHPVRFYRWRRGLVIAGVSGNSLSVVPRRR